MDITIHTYLQENNWIVKKSISPIWEDIDILKSIPDSKFFLIHARSSSFPNHKNKIEYNQPFISGKFSFVFNGFIKGEIGSQKIWNLLLKFLERNPTKESLILLKNEILKNSKNVFAINIGLCDKKNIYVLCYFETNPEYYSLLSSQNSSLYIISSEKICGYEFKNLDSGELVIL